MRPSQFHTPFVRLHFVMTLEGTNNLLFHLATVAPLDDKRVNIPDDLRSAMGWPVSIRTMYDYRTRIPGIYNRLYQICIISLCADVEFFFKALFEDRKITPPKSRGFFQRFNEVIAVLEKNGFALSALSGELALLRQAFAVRHACIHNFGIVDQDFANKSSRPVTVGEIYTLNQTEYLSMSDAYRVLLMKIDGQLALVQPAVQADGHASGQWGNR